MGRKKNKSMTQEEEKKFIREVQKYKKNGLPVSWSQIDQKLFHRRYGSNFLYQHYNRTLTVKPFQWTRECRIELLYYCDKYKSDEMISWSSMIENEAYSVSVTQLYNQYKSILRGNDSTLRDYEGMEEDEVLIIVNKAKQYREEVVNGKKSTSTPPTAVTATQTTQSRLPVKKRSRSSRVKDEEDSEEDDLDDLPPKRIRRNSDDESEDDQYVEKRTKEDYYEQTTRRMTRSAKRALMEILKPPMQQQQEKQGKDQVKTEEGEKEDANISEEAIASTEIKMEHNNPLNYLIEACSQQRENGASTSTAPLPTVAEEPKDDDDEVTTSTQYPQQQVLPLQIIRKKAILHHHQHSLLERSALLGQGIMSQLAPSGFSPPNYLVLPPISSFLGQPHDQSTSHHHHHHQYKDGLQYRL